MGVELRIPHPEKRSAPWLLIALTFTLALPPPSTFTFMHIHRCSFTGRQGGATVLQAYTKKGMNCSDSWDHSKT